MNFIKKSLLLLFIALPIYFCGAIAYKNIMLAISLGSFGGFFLVGAISEYPLKSNGKKNDFEILKIDSREYIKNYYQIVYDEKLHQLSLVTPVSLYSGESLESKVAGLLGINRQDYTADLVCNHEAIMYHNDYEHGYGEYHIVIFKDKEKAQALCELFETRIVTNKILE